MKAWQETCSKAQENLLKGKEAMINQANKQRKDVSFQIGDLVLVSAKYMRLPEPSTTKFNHCFYGPYKVLRCINNVTYNLQLPPRLCMHNTFHVSLLKKFVPKRKWGHGPPPLSLLSYQRLSFNNDYEKDKSSS